MLYVHPKLAGSVYCTMLETKKVMKLRKETETEKKKLKQKKIQNNLPVTKYMRPFNLLT